MTKKMPYIVTLFVLMLVLAACNENETKDPESINDSAQEKTVPDKSAPKEQVEAEAETEAEPEEPVKDDRKEPQYKLNPATYSIEPIGEANAKVVLLTIDDAPDKRALDMAKTLKSLDAPAIFFVNGHFITTDEKKTILKEIHDMGFMIGNHTKTHANLKHLTEDQQKEEILSVNDTVEEVIGERPVFFRAPFGSNTDYSRSLAGEEGMLLMNWSFGYDWEKQYMDKNAIADIMVNTELLRNGSNLLMHDREWTADALELIVQGLREKGYDFVDPATIMTTEQ